MITRYVEQMGLRAETVVDLRSSTSYRDDHMEGAENWPIPELDCAHYRSYILDRLGHIAPGIRLAVYSRNKDGFAKECLDNISNGGREAVAVPGGWEQYRKTVEAYLRNLPKFQFSVLHGASGSGKSSILRRLAQVGQQVLDLEAIAGMQGACLAPMFGKSLISAGLFKSRLYEFLGRCDSNRTIWTEYKGKRVTSLRLPTELFEQIAVGKQFTLLAPLEERVTRLLETYGEWQPHLDLLMENLIGLSRTLGPCLYEDLRRLAESNDTARFVRALLTGYVDPFYERMLDPGSRLRREGAVQVRSAEDLSPFLS